MPFKSEKWSFVRWAESRTRASASALALGFAFLVSAFATGAQAETRLESASPYELQSGNKVYFHWSDGSTASVDTTAGFSAVEGDTSLLIKVFNNDISAAAGQTVAVMISADDVTSTSSQKYLIPIHGAGLSGDSAPARCSATTCLGNQYKLQPNDSVDDALPLDVDVVSTDYYAARYTSNTTITIALRMDDLCRSIDLVGAGVPSYCVTSGSSSVFDPSALPASVKLTAHFAVLSTASGSVAGVPSSVQSKSFVFAFSQDEPTVGCTGSPPANWYTPEDSAIRVNADLIGVSGTTPATHLIIVGKKNNAAPSTAAATFRDNEIAGIFTSTGTKRVEGFANSSSADLASSEKEYQIQFMARNAAGVLGATPSCAQTGVRTADISGILAGETKCFIATAAFGSTEAVPVLVLRRFRDGVLRRIPGGEALVQLYYSWSPALADRIQAFPALRVLALSVLGPIELFAWLMLHPVGMGILIMLGAGILALGPYLGIRRSA